MPSDYEAVVKSIGHGITCTSDLVSELEVRQVLLELSQEIGKKLRDTKLAAGGVRICVRDNTLHHREYQTRLPFPTQSFLELTEAGIQLFHRRYIWNNHIRSLTISAIGALGQRRSISLPWEVR